MRRTVTFAAVILLMTGVVYADSVERELTLGPGGNTIGLDVEVSFEDDLKDQCNFGKYGGNYVWTNLNSGGNNPDLISPSGGGYILGLNQDTECTVDLGEFEEDEVRDSLGEKSLNEGLNLINLYSNSDMYKLWNECGRWDGIRRFELTERGLIVGFFVLKGDSFYHPFNTDYDIDRTDGAYVYAGEGGCSADLSKDFVSFDAEISQDEVSDEADLEIDISELEAEHPEYVDEDDITPSIRVERSGSDNSIEQSLDWGSDSLIVDWSDIWSGDSEENVDINVTLLESREDNYWWDSQELDLSDVNISRCGSNHDFSEFQDSCIEKNEDINTESIEEDTNWTVVTEGNSVHGLENIEASTADSEHELSINTGSTGYCGKVYFENEDLEGETSFELGIESFGGDDQGPQEAFISIGGSVEEFDIDAGSSEDYSQDIESGENLEVGLLEDTSSGCDDVYQRTRLNIDIIGE